MNKKMEETFNQIYGHFLLQVDRGIITEKEFYKRYSQFENFRLDMKYSKFEKVDIDL